PAALVATASMFAAAALSLVGAGRMTEARRRGPLRDVPRQAWAGLTYVARHPTLRGLAIGLSVMNLASGLLIVALPLVVLERLHANVAVVGALWALSAASGGVCALVAGYRGSLGRERRMLAEGGFASALALAALAVAPDLAVVVPAMLLWGAAGGWTDIGMFSLRQRRTDPEWFGRAFAVSMSLNFAGSPLGSALAGPALAPGLGVGIGAGALVTLAGTAILLRMVPVPARKVGPPASPPPPPSLV
ncbi:MAG: MFS transporter, partial [Candidatus Dormiibacterota bacterium]